MSSPGHTAKPSCSFRRTALAIVVLALAMPAHPADLPKLTESEVKAAYLFNFAKYVEWPITAFAGSNASIIIGIVGPDRITDDLRTAITGKQVAGRGFELRRAEGDADQAACHILYFPPAARARLPEVAARLRDKPVLTVGESESFVQQGGVIGFVKRGDNVRLQINLAGANTAGLKVSSKLLALADQVKGRPTKGKN